MTLFPDSLVALQAFDCKNLLLASLCLCTCLERTKSATAVFAEQHKLSTFFSNHFRLLAALLVAFFQLILPGPVFFFFALLHWAIVGRQAGYGLLLSFADLRPQGLPVLQSTQPLPLFIPNHCLRPPPVFFIRAMSSLAVAAASLLVGADKPTVGVCRWVYLELALGFCFYCCVQPWIGWFIGHPASPVVGLRLVVQTQCFVKISMV